MIVGIVGPDLQSGSIELRTCSPLALGYDFLICLHLQLIIVIHFP